MKSATLIACSFSALVSFSAFAQGQPETISPSRQILRACAVTYKSLREFKGASSVISLSSIQLDTGAPETVFDNADASFDFMRDKHFNITGHDSTHEPFNITSTPQKTTYTWSPETKGQFKEVEDIEMAVASFTGVAASAPTIVPALLLDSGWGSPFSLKNEATLKGSEIFGGHECYVLVQKEKAVSQTTTLWIDTKTFLLRGMREEQSETSFPIEMPATAAVPADQTPKQAKVLFGNHMHVFSIEKTVPGEAELEAAAKKTVDIPAPDAAAQIN